MRYKRFSRVVWIFSFPKFWQVFEENEFFNNHRRLHSEPSMSELAIPVRHSPRGLSHLLQLAKTENPIRLGAALRSMLYLRISGDEMNQGIGQVVELLSIEPVGIVLREVIVLALRQLVAGEFIAPCRVQGRLEFHHVCWIGWHINPR